MPNKKGNEICTIDVALVTIKTAESMSEIILDTASKIEVEPQVETEDPVKLVVKGRLLAQKHSVSTLTGNQITLTDNAFIPEVVVILQGGKVQYWTTSEKTMEGDEDTGNGVSSYTPPNAGSSDKGKVFTMCAYTAIYDAAGLITGYEKIEYPNCQGTPVALSSEDGVFRVSEYVINSAPKATEPPYKISYIKPEALPHAE